MSGRSGGSISTPVVHREVLTLEMILAKVNTNSDDVEFTLCVLTPVSAAIDVVMTLSFLIVIPLSILVLNFIKLSLVDI